MNLQQARQRADRLRSIPLESVLNLSGAQADSYDKHKWHTPQGIISVTGTKFMNWNLGIGGGGAIDLAIHLNKQRFQEALLWLEQNFPEAVPLVHVPSACPPSFKPPLPCPTTLWRVKHYLITQRCIPCAMIDSLIQSGNLYADLRANAVFILLGKQNIPVGAELRGTTPHCWKAMAAGSQKDSGFFSVAPASFKNIILCESAIDAMSCFTLHPHYCCISTAGARPNPPWLQSLFDHSFGIFCGFDADPTGDYMADAMIALHPFIQRLRPCKKDWNDVLKSLS